jgi:O-acetylhomoserine (thiol)-lyase
MTSPWLYLPKRHHAGLVINSLTKCIGGHGNALGGAVTDTGLYDWTRFPNIYENYKNTKPATWGILQIRKKGLRDVGSTLAAEPAHRIATGAETLALRMDRCCANSLALARFLAAHPKVTKVYSPNRASDHPQHRLLAEARSSSATARLMTLQGLLAGGIGCCDFLNRLKLVISIEPSGRQSDARDSDRADDLLGNGWRRGGGRRGLESLIRVSVGTRMRTT